MSKKKINERMKAVIKAINKLKEKNLVKNGFLQPPKGETTDNWKKLKD